MKSYEREIVCSEEWRLENESLEKRKKELRLDVEKESDSIMQLNNSIVHIDNDKVRFDCPLVDSLLVQLNLLVLI